jgi:hypothetical protein
MLITDIHTTHSLQRIRLDARIQTEKNPGEFHVFYDFPRRDWLDLSLHSGDALAALTLLPAMTQGESLIIDAPLSYRLAESLSQLQDVFSTMHPDWSVVEIQAPIKHHRRPFLPARRKRGLFFSLGVDSFFSLQQLLEENYSFGLSHLLVIHGLDVFYRRKNHGVFKEVLQRARQVGEECDLKVLDVVTNLRDFSDHFVNWETQYGCATFSIGLALQRGFETVYLASGMSDYYDGFLSYGSGPLITPHWSTERLRFIQHGGGADRQDKINAISGFALALEHLRVCWENPGNLYNCGKCEKCLRTMLGLLISGGLDTCQTLPDQIPLSELEKIRIKNPTTIHIYQRLMDDLLSQDGSQDLSRKIAAVLSQKIADFQQG